MQPPSSVLGKPRNWTTEHALLLLQARHSAGLESGALAIRNSLSLKQMHELENEGCSAFYSESIKYATGVKVLKKLEVSFEHLEAAIDPFSPLEDDAGKVLPTQDSRIQDGPELLNITFVDSKKHSLGRRMILVMTVVLIAGLGYGMLATEHTQPHQQVTKAVETSMVEPRPVAEASALPFASAASQPTPSMALNPLATAPLTENKLLSTSKNDMCQFAGRGVEVVSSNPTKPSDYVYLTAVQNTQICIKDATGKATFYVLIANQSQNLRGIPPFYVAMTKPGHVKIYYQGQRVYTKSDFDYVILKSTKTDKTSALSSTEKLRQQL